MKTKTIDLNADIGEHPGTLLDEQIMPHISSCNIACGGHAGDEHSVRHTIKLAQAHGVAIGAHPSFPDKENFGRTIISMDPPALEKSITNQILLVKRLCEEVGAVLYHIKPHGALYNLAAGDFKTSMLICNVIKHEAPEVFWMGQARSVSENVAQKEGVKFIAEGFADRRYEPDGALRSRRLRGAVLTPDEALTQAKEMVCNERVRAGNKWLPLRVQSLCLHSDTEGAVSLAKQIHELLVNEGIQIAAVQ